MKIKNLVLSIFALAASNSLMGVTVTADSGGFSQAIVDSANIPIPIGEGFISVGYFSTFTSGTNFGTLTGADIAGDFNSFGSSFQFGSTGFPGFYQEVVDGGRVGSSSGFLGQNVFTVIGNASTTGRFD